MLSSCENMPVVVLISGNGSNLQAIIDAKNSGYLPIDIRLVISNNPDVQGIKRAEKAGIATTVINHREFASRDEFDCQLQNHIDQHQPKLVILAGFMRIFTTAFTEHYQGRMINIHPSLLPKYTGLNTHQRALDAGDSQHGATVHFVTPELDGGPAIIQTQVPILEDDTASILAARVLKQEHKIYPEAIKWYSEGRLCLRDNASYLDGEKLPATGIIFPYA